MKIIINIFSIIIINLFLQNISYCQIVPTDLIQKLNTNINDSTQFSILNQLSEYYLKVDSDSCLFFLLKAKRFSKNYPNHLLTMNYYKIYGKYSLTQNDFENAERYNELHKQIANINHQKNEILYAQNNIIVTKINRGYFTTAISDYLKFLDTIKQSNVTDPKIFRLVFGNLSHIYRQLNKDSVANYYAKKVLPFCQSKTDSLDYYYGYYLANNDDTVSLKIGLQLSNDLNDNKTRLTLLNGYSDYLIRHKMFNKALIENNKSLQLGKKIGNLQLMVLYHNYGEIYNGLKKFNLALKYFNITIPYFENTKDKYMLQNSLINCSKSYIGLKNYKKGYEIYIKAMNIKEELSGIEKQKLVLEIEAQYELNEKEIKLTSNKLEIKIQKERTQFEMHLKYLFIGLMSLSILLLCWAAYNFHKKKKLSLSLANEKDIVEHQAQKLAQINASKDKLFAMIAHDLRSPISTLKNNLTILNLSLIKNKKNDLIKQFDKVNYDLDNVQLILNNLLHWASIQINALRFSPQNLSIKNLIETIIKQSENSLLLKNIKIIRQIDNTFYFADENQLLIVLRNILSNAIKFTPYGGFIKITTKSENSRLIIEIKDSGIGMSSSTLNDVFNYPTPQKGTNGEKGTGLGLSLCKELIEKNGGDINIISNPQEGTIVIIIFPF